MLEKSRGTYYQIDDLKARVQFLEGENQIAKEEKKIADIQLMAAQQQVADSSEEQQKAMAAQAKEIKKLVAQQVEERKAVIQYKYQ